MRILHSNVGALARDNGQFGTIAVRKDIGLGGQVLCSKN